MRILDLTMPIDERTPIFPGDPRPVFHAVENIKEHGSNVTQFSLSSHFGTHVDAPQHMIPNGRKLGEFPLDKFIGSAVVLDVRGMGVIDHDLAGVRDGDIVLFCTGHTKCTGEGFFDNIPVISEATAQRLIERNAKLIGLDSPSPDRAPYEVHKMLLPKEVLIVENLVNLEPLIDSRFMCYALPLKLNADGAPCRVAAVLDSVDLPAP